MSIPEADIPKLDEFLDRWLEAVARKCHVSVPPATLEAARADVRRHFHSMHGRVIEVDGRPACSICGSRGIFLVERRQVLHDIDARAAADNVKGASLTRIPFLDQPREVHDEHGWTVECGCGAQLALDDAMKVVVGDEILGRAVVGAF